MKNITITRFYENVQIEICDQSSRPSRATLSFTFSPDAIMRLRARYTSSTRRIAIKEEVS